MSYSFDGTSWVTALTFGQPMSVNHLSVYAGNDAGTAHTAVVDYFFNTASPIFPEDSDEVSLNVGVVGNGSVTRTPDSPSYPVGTLVQLEAIPGNVDGARIVAALHAAGVRCVVMNPRMYPEFPPFKQLFPGLARTLEREFRGERVIRGGETEWIGLVRREP